MSRSQSHQRKYLREFTERSRVTWEMATHDLVAIGAGCVFVGNDGSVRHVYLKDVYDGDKIKKILTQRQLTKI